MSNVHVTSNRAFVDRALRPDRGETAANGFVQGAVDLEKDPEIESEAYRLKFLPGEGDISIMLTIGDTPGDLRVTVQYEGEKGKHQECLAQQATLLHDTADWLRDILAAFAGDWNIDIVSAPCPEGDTRVLRLHEVQARLMGTVGTEIKPEHRVGPSVERGK